MQTRFSLSWSSCILLAASFAPIGCATPVPPGDAGANVDPTMFNDHTVRRIDSRAAFDALATRDHGIASVKLIITGFSNPRERELRFYDTRFFSLHDEWYWFRLLNGAPIPGDDGVRPVTGLSLPTIRAVYAWARMQPSLPLDLQIAGDRLYSWRFYDLAFGRSRNRGLSTLLHLDARTGASPAPERWAFELEFGDELTHEELVTFFEATKAALAPAIANELRFVVRSAEQEALAQRMERERLPYWDKILRYRDLVVPGAREVYSDGITAGALRVIRAGQRFDDATAEEVLVFEQIPDVLPPAAGVVTAVPQTPLAHINLLARNRGIPNTHIAGVLEDPEIDQLARGWARVVLFAESPSRVVLRAITNDQYDRYRVLLRRPARAVVTPPVSSMPYIVDLATRPLSERASLIPMLGGKSTGFLGLIHDAAVVRPDRPHGISVRAYVEHLAPLRARIEAALMTPRFDADARVRQVVLEGVDTFRMRNAGPEAQTFLDTLLRGSPAGTPFGDLVRNGGVRGLIERTAIAPTTLTTITAALRVAYGDLALTQGIRFRSSSNVEDIEGFNGAGLYESYTGFIDAAMQPSSADRAKTVERALQRVWGSFWGFEAFEERRVEGIDHLTPAMGVTVHPRFDDALERATGVCTFTVMPPNAPDDARLEVNVQAGDQSVANPDPMILPEVVRVLRARGTNTLRIERVRRSSLSPNADLLNEATLRRLFDDTARVTTTWLANDNSIRPAAQRNRTLTLDFEFHDMFAGWPALRSGVVRPARLVLKQARSLEPGVRIALPEASMWPLSRDVLVRARRVTIDTCSADLMGGGRFRATILRTLTDASIPPDVGYATIPFDASLTLAVEGVALPELAWDRGAMFSADHTAMTVSREGATTRYVVTAGAPAAQGFERFELTAGGRATVTFGARRYETTLQCVTDLRYASPRDYLLSLVTM
jgi:hypothetical protein